MNWCGASGASCTPKALTDFSPTQPGCRCEGLTAWRCKKLYKHTVSFFAFRPAVFAPSYFLLLCRALLFPTSRPPSACLAMPSWSAAAISAFWVLLRTLKN